MPNLVLTGFMGTGKSTVGKKLARKLGLKFVDTDHEVERVTSMTVNEIFQKYGEIRFRSEEKAAVRRLAAEDNQVISTGGGVVLDQENIDVLRKNGLILGLAALPEVILERIQGNKTRPLLKTDNPLETISKMLAERKPFYACADEIIDTTGLSLDEVVAEISLKYSGYCAKLNS